MAVHGNVKGCCTSHIGEFVVLPDVPVRGCALAPERSLQNQYGFLVVRPSQHECHNRRDKGRDGDYREPVHAHIKPQSQVAP